jgi:hypothetical protein
MQKASDPFDMPLLSWVNDYVKTLTSTSYIILSILFNLTALFLSVLFTWTMDNFFSDLRQNGAFLGMFRIIEFLAVNIFMKVRPQKMRLMFATKVRPLDRVGTFAPLFFFEPPMFLLPPFCWGRHDDPATSP